MKALKSYWLRGWGLKGITILKNCSKRDMLHVAWAAIGNLKFHNELLNLKPFAVSRAYLSAIFCLIILFVIPRGGDLFFIGQHQNVSAPRHRKASDSIVTGCFAKS